MQGIPMVASSPVRHDSPLGVHPVEVQAYQPPWKALTEFALHSDLEQPAHQPVFQQLVNQVSGDVRSDGVFFHYYTPPYSPNDDDTNGFTPGTTHFFLY